MLTDDGAVDIAMPRDPPTDGLKGMEEALAAWRRAWSRVVSFFAFPLEIRRVIYATNALDSVTKLIWLALRNIPAKRERAAPPWCFAIR